MIPDRYAPQAYALMRIVFGFLFVFHGLQKMFGLFGSTIRVFPEIRWFAMVLEVVGGPLIMLGWFTKPVAFILSGEMAFGYFITHFPMGFWPIQNGGEPAVLFSFAYLYMSAKGAGIWSIDALRARK
jgi:putative oxidoreductase